MTSPQVEEAAHNPHTSSRRGSSREVTGHRSLACHERRRTSFNRPGLKLLYGSYSLISRNCRLALSEEGSSVTCRLFKRAQRGIFSSARINTYIHLTISAGFTLVRTLLIHECTIEAEILSLKDYC
eukprot:scaffold3117_cov139-Skeletonema_dohrnii-CCMP3373.AAC.2